MPGLDPESNTNSFMAYETKDGGGPQACRRFAYTLESITLDLADRGLKCRHMAGLEIAQNTA
jgi:hypothetical protein